MLEMVRKTHNNNNNNNLWNMTVIPIWVAALGTGFKGLGKRQEELEIGGIIKTIQQLRSARILKRLFATWGGLPSLRLQCKILNKRLR